MPRHVTGETPMEAAAEYALGLLEGEELRAARQRAATDPPFAARVARWRGRLATLAAEVAEVQAPTSAWPRIQRSVGDYGRENVVVLRRRVNLWRGAATGATALAASLALVLVPRDLPQSAPPSSKPMVAMIKAGTEVAAVASWDPSSRRLLVSEVKMPVRPGHNYELWLIPAGGKAHSLGVMPDRPHIQLAESMSAMVASGATLAVSLEPAGGSRAEGPSGPVVASGPITVA